DCCAAPGGKAAYLAELMGGTGRVYAWDVHEHRVDLIRAQARRLGLENLRPAVRDAARLKEDLVERMDAVLLDAPCTGLGVMLEKPDVKYRHQPADLKALAQLQNELLDTCCQYVKKGGVMVYSTCSILKDENERQAAAFLQRHPEFEKVAEHQLLSHRDGMDGFYMIKMLRR
ncbi:MAG: methyltransferase domain-containing protein, partial [Clostridia bacterium]|nr:methyltransferase domain-containing protein [Clostridia bacterium]